MELVATFRAARRAGTPLMAIRTADPAATIHTLQAGAFNGSVPPLLQWDVVNGIKPINKQGEAAAVDTSIKPEDTVNPVEALIAAQRLPAKSILFYHNAHRVISEQGVSQAIWNLRDQYKFHAKSLVLLCPSIDLPVEIQQDVLVLDEPLPDAPALEAIIRGTYQGASLPAPEGKTVAKATDAILGLAAFPAEQVCAMSISKTGMDIEQLWERKRQSIETQKGLTVWRGKERFSDIGGYENLKEFLGRVIAGKRPMRGVVFIDEIEKAIGTGQDTSGVSQDMLGQMLAWLNDRDARALLLVGPPGTSKSMFAKATGNQAGVPTIAFDIGGMKGSHVGESEAAMRSGLKVCDAVTQQQPLVIGTCNSIEVLPPELRRRFTLGVFFVDLPDVDEREAIWTLYEAKYGLKPQCRPENRDWTGAEIKTCCQTASDLSLPLLDASKYIVPVAKSAHERIEKLRESASGRYISASYAGVYQKPAAHQSMLRKVEV